MTNIDISSLGTVDATIANEKLLIAGSRNNIVYCATTNLNGTSTTNFINAEVKVPTLELVDFTFFDSRTLSYTYLYITRRSTDVNNLTTNTTTLRFSVQNDGKTYVDTAIPSRYTASVRPYVGGSFAILVTTNNMYMWEFTSPQKRDVYIGTIADIEYYSVKDFLAPASIIYMFEYGQNDLYVVMKEGMIFKANYVNATHIMCTMGITTFLQTITAAHISSEYKDILFLCE
jgi:hypothetical protein